ncbi:MAG TPA: 2Fe-2S iron-sulfur cluster-binding protein [Oligoflexus sp.]|uniref:2Fe-2S iron-sulfur cluster-binding protein n=1 Tax=Oligoflexus sp. TaxID=1971216 RepID=UPI002D7ED9C3|nr:2Fe-2S iron-sulfur cluster-binding protein [Oligoflexus sp.]HET9236574.1 2Fe-2S iron-sulfur cluster-binding protein [Oligoflexus sp.]
MNFHIQYQGRTVPLNQGETVLEALERTGIDVPSSCRAGACQTCMMRATEGSVPHAAQAGLKETLKKSGHFLSCICRPAQNLVCEPAHTADFRGPVTIQEIRPLGPDVVLVQLSRPPNFDFNPGQFVTLRRADAVSRSYSIASQRAALDTLDIHVRRVPQGQLSGWFHQEARPGDELWLEGPKGDCFYYPGNPEEPLLLIGTGTGMAPLFAVALDACQQGHTGPISIYHGALSADRFYLVEELQELTRAFPQISYVRCVLKGPAESGIQVGELKDIVLSGLTDPKQKRVYLCGDPGLVRILKKQIFLAGVSMNRLHADPFVGTGA